MRGRLAALKNIAWAFGIVICLLAVFIGLLFSAFSRSGEKQFRGGVPLGTETSGTTEETDHSGGRPVQISDGTLKTLPESEDAGQEYLDSLYFLVDSSMIGLRDYGILSGGTATAQVWATPSGVLAIADMDESKIVYPGDGSIISAANAAMIVQPRILVISLGNDGIGGTNQFDFIQNYEILINGIRETSPETYIICLPLSSVTIDYASTDGASAALCNEAVSWIQQVCSDTGAYYCDAVASVLDESGVLLQEYASANGKTLNSTGLSQVLQYLRYHAIS